LISIPFCRFLNCTLYKIIHHDAKLFVIFAKITDIMCRHSKAFVATEIKLCFVFSSKIGILKLSTSKSKTQNQTFLPKLEK